MVIDTAFSEIEI